MVIRVIIYIYLPHPRLGLSTLNLILVNYSGPELIVTMRICVLQSAYPADVNRDHDPGYHPEFYVPMHSFEHRWIHRKTAQAQLDAALEEQFDVYFNLMWGELLTL